jgi:hypothetical protein
MSSFNISIRKDFNISLFGFSGVAPRQDWAVTGKRLMDRLWHEVRSFKIPNKGLNVWVYDEGSQLFTGVELLTPPPTGSPLENKTISLPAYAWYKHVGPYSELKMTYEAAREEFKRAGIHAGLPCIEIYGHWTDDPSKLETELLWNIS